MSESETTTLRFGDEDLVVPNVLPILPVRNAVVFPGMNVPLTVGRPRSLSALDLAGDGGLLVVATQRDPELEDPGLADLHPIACISRIVRVVDARQQARQALVMGLVRARMIELSAYPAAGEALQVRIEPLEEPAFPGPEAEAARRQVLELAHRVIDARDDYPDEWKALLTNMPTPGLLADLVGSNVAMPFEEAEYMDEERWTGAFRPQNL